MESPVKLSVVILCWNDLRVLPDCLRSIFEGTRETGLEVIVSDNGSTDGSIEFIAANYPQVRLVKNGMNLRFSRGNNAGIRISRGEYVLILNPDTIIHDGSLDALVAYAERHPRLGGVGCRVVGADEKYQPSGRPFPTVWRLWTAGLCLRFLGRFFTFFIDGEYEGWKGNTERAVDWLSGCCMMFRGDLLRQFGGFDPQFTYYYEDVDLCHRVRDAGYELLFTPSISITHLGGQSSSKRFPIPFEVDKYRNRYRYFRKYFGRRGAWQCRRANLVALRVRQFGYGLLQLLHSTELNKHRLDLFRVAIAWNAAVDPVKLVENGQEPEIAFTTALQSS